MGIKKCAFCKNERSLDFSWVPKSILLNLKIMHQLCSYSDNFVEYEQISRYINTEEK